MILTLDYKGLLLIMARIEGEDYSANVRGSILFFFLISLLLSFVSFAVHLGYGWILLCFALNCGGMNK